MKFLKLFLVLSLSLSSSAFASTCFDDTKPSHFSEQCDSLRKRTIEANHDFNFRIRKLSNVVKNNSNYHRLAPLVQELNVRSYALLRQLNTYNCCYDSTRDDLTVAFQDLERQYRTTERAIAYVSRRHPNVDVDLHSERVSRSFRTLQSRVTTYIVLETQD